MSLHRADHGKDVRQYLFIGNFERVERNEQLIPNHEPGEEAMQFMSTPLMQKFLNHFDFQEMRTEATTYIDIHDYPGDEVQCNYQIAGSITAHGCRF